MVCNSVFTERRRSTSCGLPGLREHLLYRLRFQLQLSLAADFAQTPLKKGLLLGIMYTWSKALGTQAVDLPGINGFGAPHIDNNQRLANHASETGNRTGFGAVTAVRPPRDMQKSARFQF